MSSEAEKSQGLSRRSAAARLAAVSVLGVAGLPMSVSAQSRRHAPPAPPTTPPEPEPTPGTPATPVNPAPTPAPPPTQTPAKPAPAQQSTEPEQPEVQTKPSPLDKVITPGRENAYTLRVNVHVNHFQKVLNDQVVTSDLVFDTATVVFPVLVGSASHATDIQTPDQVDGKLSFDDKAVDDSAEFSTDKDCGTRLALWKMGAAKGGEMDLNVSIPMRTWSTTFNEAIAAKAVWPKKWSKTAQSCFTAGSQFGVDFANKPVQDAVKQWTGGKDPKALSPLVLAKFLAGKVIETVRVSGSGVATSRVGLMEGVEIAKDSASQALASGKANPFAMTAALCAAYLAAGLPARTVIGYDIKAKKSDEKFLNKGEGSNKIVSWVEFCLHDEDANKDAWIPVDAVRQQAKSSRVPAAEKPWDYFGNHKDLQFVLPFAFQFHPPARGVVSHGSPAFWGWFTTPTINDQAEQYIKFDAITTPKRAK